MRDCDSFLVNMTLFLCVRLVCLVISNNQVQPLMSVLKEKQELFSDGWMTLEQKKRVISASRVSVHVDANEIRFRCQRVLINLEVIQQVRCVKVGGSGVVEAGKPLVEQSPTN